VKNRMPFAQMRHQALPLRENGSAARNEQKAAALAQMRLSCAISFGNKYSKINFLPSQSALLAFKFVCQHPFASPAATSERIVNFARAVNKGRVRKSWILHQAKIYSQPTRNLQNLAHSQQVLSAPTFDISWTRKGQMRRCELALWRKCHEEMYQSQKSKKPNFCRWKCLCA
jgi:hypothetical protein